MKRKCCITHHRQILLLRLLLILNGGIAWLGVGCGGNRGGVPGSETAQVGKLHTSTTCGLTPSGSMASHNLVPKTVRRIEFFLSFLNKFNTEN